MYARNPMLTKDVCVVSNTQQYTEQYDDCEDDVFLRPSSPSKIYHTKCQLINNSDNDNDYSQYNNHNVQSREASPIDDLGNAHSNSSGEGRHTLAPVYEMKLATNEEDT